MSFLTVLGHALDIPEVHAAVESAIQVQQKLKCMVILLACRRDEVCNDPLAQIVTFLSSLPIVFEQGQVSKVYAR